MSYKLDHEKMKLTEALGLTIEDEQRILRKLLIVAELTGDYRQTFESLINDPTFNIREKHLGLFLLGKIYGVQTLVKMMKQWFGKKVEFRGSGVVSPLDMQIVDAFRFRGKPRMRKDAIKGL